MFAVELKHIALVRAFQVSSGYPTHHFDQIRRYPEHQVTHAQHDHLRHRRGERQHQFELRSLSAFSRCFNAATQCVDLGAHDIQTNATTGKLRDQRRS